MVVAERSLSGVDNQERLNLDDLVTVIRMNGGLYLKPKDKPETIGQAKPLSPREVEILTRVAVGTSNKEIANFFAISEHTVKNHLTSIMQKLEARDRTHAVVIALRHGWLSI